MQDRCRRLLLVGIILLGATVGVAEPALAQTTTHFPIPTLCTPHGIATGPDGAMWFAESDANNIGRITTAGVITEFPLPTAGSYPNFITAGPDGALWFTESGVTGGHNHIGRITTAGVITEFPIPTVGLSDGGITTGPDGALWFIEETANQIGRITTDGVITEFPLPTANSSPYGITTGPDGALWFTEGGRIGRITTTGVIAEFPISMDAVGITAGPDGALWFTGWGPPYTINRITTAGVVTEFMLSTDLSFPGGITTGPDGALWFTGNTPGGGIGRITTAGVIMEFLYPGSVPIGITTGPDGALWFTEAGLSKIGRLPDPPLQVSPATAIAASGPQGGPFSPASFQYQLSATSDSVNYSIAWIPPWLNANVTSGTATTAPVTVTLSLINVGRLTPDNYTATIAFINTDTSNGNTTRTATLMVKGAVTAAPASGGAPLAVTFTTNVAQEDINSYTVNFGDGTVSSPMGVRPSGIACTANPPCFTGIASTSHTFTSPGTYTAALLNSSGTSVATATVVIGGAAPRVSQPGKGFQALPSGAPLMRPPRPAFGGLTGTDNTDRTADASDEVNE